MTNFLDTTGLTRLWGKIKDYFIFESDYLTESDINSIIDEEDFPIDHNFTIESFDTASEEDYGSCGIIWVNTSESLNVSVGNYIKLTTEFPIEMSIPKAIPFDTSYSSLGDSTYGISSNTWSLYDSSDVALPNSISYESTTYYPLMINDYIETISFPMVSIVEYSDWNSTNIPITFEHYIIFEVVAFLDSVSSGECIPNVGLAIVDYS